MESWSWGAGQALFLVGREEDLVLGRATEGTTGDWELASDRGMYFSDYAVLGDGYVIYFHAVDKFNLC
jgi:hypothetical protein